MHNIILRFYKDWNWKNTFKDKSYCGADKFLIYGICILTILVAIRAIYGYAYNIQLPNNNFEFFIGIGFPLLFLIKQDLCNIAITLCLIALLLTKQWIGVICVIITFFFLIFKSNKLLAILLLSIILPFAFIPNDKLGNLLEQFKNRLEIQIFTLSHWQKIWLGHGLHSFKNIPNSTYQLQNNPDKRWWWINASHSDFIQGLYEFGILGMLPITFLMLLPFIWFKIEPLSISYLCILFQSIVDFPFHRLITGILSLLIILMMYEKGLYKNSNSYI